MEGTGVDRNGTQSTALWKGEEMIGSDRIVTEGKGKELIAQQSTLERIGMDRKGQQSKALSIAVEWRG